MALARSVLVFASFCVVAAADLNFLVMGDWGGSGSSPYTTPDEVATAKGMGIVGAASNSTFALALGDNFYSEGVKNEHDPRFQSTFENVFTAESLKADNYFRVVAGNHDHNGNVTAQIAYSALSNRWSFPSLYYSFTETSDDGTTLQVVYIDTVVLSGASMTKEGVELTGAHYPGAADQELADTQMQWLENELATSTADYLVVAGHYPVWSICEHGPTKYLVDNVKPLLEKYHVTAYLNGHDHCAEHIDEGTGIDYHVIGSAHVWDTSTEHASAIPKNSLKFHPSDGTGGFALVSVNKTAFVVTHMTADGKVIYVAPARPPRGSEPAPGSWDCHSKTTFTNPTKLTDQDNKKSVSFDQCKQSCIDKEDCVVVVHHVTDNHCHTLTGTISATEYSGNLEADSEHETCMLM